MPMKWIGKVTGGLLGGLALGPIGAALGVLLGHQFDEMNTEEEEPPASEQLAAIGARFFRASFEVMGYLAKADGRVSEREITAARAVMDELRLTAAQVREAIACFTAGKQPDYDYAAELAQLGHICRGRPELARVFLEIQVRAALAGNDLEGPVRPLIGRLAAALGVPVVTVFGSSDPAWTETGHPLERKVMVHLDCQPCMQRTCPLVHHNCMKMVTIDMVEQAAEELLSGQRIAVSSQP